MLACCVSICHCMRSVGFLSGFTSLDVEPMLYQVGHAAVPVFDESTVASHESLVCAAMPLTWGIIPLGLVPCSCQC